jgi:tetratricopeptide (TPR) repeat protein
MRRSIASVTLILLSLATLSFAAKGAVIPTDHMMKGYIAQQSGDFDRAASHFRKAVELDPEAVTPRLKLVRLLFLVGEVDQALEVLERGLELRPDHPGLLTDKAKGLLMSGRNNEAAAAAAAGARNGKNPKVSNMATRLLQGVGDYEQALEVSTKWIEQFPEDAEAHFATGLALERLDRAQEAESAFRKALEFLPSHFEAMEALGDLLTRQGKSEEAIPYYRQLITSNPHALDPRLSLVELLIREGKIDEAIALLDEAMRWLNGGHSQKARLSILNQQVGRAKVALEILESIPEGRRDARSWLLLGLLHLSAEQYEPAFAALEMVTEKSPFYTEALIRKSLALKGMGKKDEAPRLLYGWLAEHPDDLEVTLALAAFLQDDDKLLEAATLLEEFQVKLGQSDTRVLFTLGVLYDKLKDWENSVQYMMQILEIDPDNAHALNYIGYTYAEHGIELEEAERMIVRAMELLPDNGYIVDSLGWVYYKQGRYKKAVEMLRIAASMSPKDSVIWEHLGDALLGNGLPGEAREAYIEALKLDPDSDNLSGKLDELQ